MPKRTDIKSILILGAGPIVIGQACEFDYSGAQACKALREEGYRVILVNSNPATIMTDPEMADATYIEPIHWEVVRKIIEKERPDAVLPTMGGQTALNCALELERQGVLEEFGVTMIGATADAIDKAEDRRRFDVAMKKIGLETARSGIAHTMEEALAATDGAQIGAVYATDDDVAIGVLTALQEAENTTVKTVVGCGGSQTFLLLIHTTAGLNLATTVYSPESIEQCVDIANTLTIQGTQPAQKEYITEMPLVDRNNAADYINPASRY